MTVAAPRSENAAAGLAGLFAAVLRAEPGGFRRYGKVEDLGGGSARLTVRVGARRNPGAVSSEVDTLRELNIVITETPEGQIRL